ncbi:MAG: dipeptidase [Rhodospirillaceae bacterium]|jgi:membrane dipeptidase|nr:dipeptidase [Rhodospirillaceae bacterium]MBT3491150.1 dipeptidase [Rhodospirillaceae bacterium]MBT3781227.1 dipeptidase [Rhodospirillaceae bacterium]MBT3979453.1 dipeptidase [Rhodospirillaceae bacterium]MBT4167948.1 dipeptidase [Rhodospirillaceae bacterium]
MTAAELQNRALVIDGLSYHSDGYTGDLRAGGINALNVTLNHFEADFTESCEKIAGWLAYMAVPDAEWAPIRQASDLAAAKDAGKIGLIMGWQNMRPVADDLDRIHLFHQLGVRVMQPTYNYRNFMGDGNLETEDAGLSILGRDAVGILNELGIAIDISHVGDHTSRDILALSTQPVLATHVDARALTPLARNKDDDILRAVANSGGVIGVSVYGPMLWDGDRNRRPSIDDFIRHLDYITELVGIEHVGFGTDIPVSNDLRRTAQIAVNRRLWSGISDYGDCFGHDIPARYAAGANNHSKLPNITAALLERGWAEADIEAYLGANFARVLGEIWGG